MSDIKVAPFQPGQEEFIVQIHNAAFAEWMNQLEPCYRYSRLTIPQLRSWLQSPATSLWIGNLDEIAVGYACYQVKREQGQQEFLALEFELTQPDWGQSR